METARYKNCEKLSPPAARKEQTEFDSKQMWSCSVNGYVEEASTCLNNKNATEWTEKLLTLKKSNYINLDVAHVRTQSGLET